MNLAPLAIPARAVEIIAHRGASFDAPENTTNRPEWLRQQLR